MLKIGSESVSTDHTREASRLSKGSAEKFTAHFQIFNFSFATLDGQPAAWSYEHPIARRHWSANKRIPNNALEAHRLQQRIFNFMGVPKL
jgi:hypothetical protein